MILLQAGDSASTVVYQLDSHNLSSSGHILPDEIQIKTHFSSFPAQKLLLPVCVTGFMIIPHQILLINAQSFKHILGRLQKKSKKSDIFPYYPKPND